MLAMSAGVNMGKTPHSFRKVCQLTIHLAMKDKTISQAGELTCAPLPPCRILLVEDEPHIRQLNTGALIHSGYHVDAAEDGAAGWEALGADSYDLMITDNNMPGLTGVELLKKLHASRMALPVIMATGELPKEEFTRYPWLQPAAMLLKPYTIAELLGTVKKVLREADSADDGSQLFKHRDIKANKMSPAGEPAGAPRQGPTNSPRRILVVDDDSDTRQLSVDVLVGSGYDVDAVIDGAAGWDALQATSYDLTITDNKMPRMTGIEMIEKLHSARMTLPVIMATRYLPMNEFARKPWLKPDATLQRPFSNDDLLEAVKKVLLMDDGNDGHTKTLLPKYL
jgi:DNA-binding response OmpR family regulator